MIDGLQIAILAVHEAMAKKVDRETLAVAIIPQVGRGRALRPEYSSHARAALGDVDGRTAHRGSVSALHEDGARDGRASREGA